MGRRSRSRSPKRSHKKRDSSDSNSSDRYHKARKGSESKKNDTPTKTGVETRSKSLIPCFLQTRRFRFSQK